jgi:hypothetical protein
LPPSELVAVCWPVPVVVWLEWVVVDQLPRRLEVKRREVRL